MSGVAEERIAEIALNIRLAFSDYFNTKVATPAISHTASSTSALAADDGAVLYHFRSRERDILVCAKHSFITQIAASSLGRANDGAEAAPSTPIERALCTKFLKTLAGLTLGGDPPSADFLLQAICENPEDFVLAPTTRALDCFTITETLADAPRQLLIYAACTDEVTRDARTGAPPEAQAKWRRRVSRVVSRLPLDVETQIGVVTMALDDLVAIKAGARLTFASSAPDRVTVKISGREVLSGRLGDQGGRKAVKIDPALTQS